MTQLGHYVCESHRPTWTPCCPICLLNERDHYREALEKIAAGERPDGTYNLSRKACELIAKEALSE